MPSLYVTFDTNVYVSLPDAEFDKIRSLERQQRVQALAHFIPILELVSHLENPRDKDFGRSVAGLRRLWSHCSRYDGSRQALRFAVDSEAQVPLTLFGRSPENRDRHAESRSELVRAICESSLIPSAEYSRAVDWFAADSAKVKAKFIDDVRKGILAFDPQAKSWQPFEDDATKRSEISDWLKSGEGRSLAARALARKAAREIGITPSAEPIEFAHLRVLEHWGAAVHYYEALIRKIVETGFDLSKHSRANAIWDFHLTFLAAPGARVQGRPFRLVTDDKAIRNAARAASCAEAVLSVEEYIALLKEPDRIATLA